MTDFNANEPVVQTHDGVMVGVQPASTPAQVRQSAFSTGTVDNGPTAAVTVPPQGQGERLFTAEEVARFRQQEKEKLYPQLQQLNTMREELDAIKAEREAAKAEREAEIADRLAAEEEARRANMTAKEMITELDTKWSQRFDNERAERERAEALLERERQMAAVDEYKRGRLEQETDIIPSLHRFVGGATPEEVERSIEAVRATSSEILNEVLAVQQQQRTGMRGVSPSAPATGPMENMPEQRQLTAAEIRNLSDAEYRQYRGQLLGSAGAMFRGGSGR